MIRTSLDGHVIKRMLPVIVWFAALGGTVMLLQYRMQDYQLVGVARDNSRRVAAIETGRVKDVGVRLFQQVQRGQVLARMQDDHIQSQLQTVRAEIGKLQAEMENVRDEISAQAQQFESEKAAEHRRFVLDVETARLKILELKATIEPQLVQLGSLATEVQIEKDLYDAGAVTTDYALNAAKNEYDVIAKSIEENKKLLAMAEKSLEQAVERYDLYKQTAKNAQSRSIELAVAPIRGEIDVQEALLGELQVQRMRLDLRAPEDGTVRQILAGAGETVVAGQPVVVVAPDRSTEVVAYVKQNQYVDVAKGMQVQLIRNGTELQMADARVHEVSAGYQLLPERLWQDPQVPEWGRSMLIEIPHEFDIAPGEIVGVRCL